METLKDFFDGQWSNDSNEVAKHAAAANMSAEEWQRQTVQEQQSRDYEDKVAAENNMIAGMVTGQGIKDGIAQELAKFASAGGRKKEAAETLFGVFCKD